MVSKATFNKTAKLSSAQAMTRLLALLRGKSPASGMMQARHVVWYGYQCDACKFIKHKHPPSDIVAPEDYRSYANAKPQVLCYRLDGRVEIGLVIDVSRGRLRLNRSPDAVSRNDNVCRLQAYACPARLCKVLDIKPLCQRPGGGLANFYALGTADVVRLEPSDKVLFELLTERLEENDVSIEVDLTPASCASVAEAVEGFPHPSLNAKLFLMMHS